MKILNILESKIINYNIFTNVYSITRTILALATFLLLLFNSTDVLLPFGVELLPIEFIPIPTLFEINLDFGFSLEFTRCVMLVLLIPILLGFYPRIFGIIHWYICYSIQSNGLVLDGGEQIATVLTFLLIPLTLIDSRRNHWTNPEEPSPFYVKCTYFLFLSIIKIQVTLIYAHAAIGRLPNKEWGEGTAVYYFFNDALVGLPTYQHYFLDPILESPLVVLVTWSVTILELLIASAIFWKSKYRRMILVTGILFHIGIMLTIGIITFGMVMIASLVIYLYPSQKNIKIIKRKEKQVYEKVI